MFAFEPRQGDLISDMGFKYAIEAVSAGGQVRWGVEHLYYEVCRRKRARPMPVALILLILLVSVVVIAVAFFNPDKPSLWVVAVIAWVAALVATVHRIRGRFVRIDRETFSRMWERWCETHGTPQGVIQRRDQLSRPVAEPDLGDYSFDRAVICDRARTVDLLLANNFHFENNCAVLSVDGYPRLPFETVRTMLKRNPRLQVFVLHDATPNGCRLAHQLATNPEWFAGGYRVIDVGVRPGQALAFRGLYQLPEDKPAAGEGISPAEANWLNSQFFELAAIRPEQVLKRLFHAINHAADLVELPAGAAAVAGAVLAAPVIFDDVSFGSARLKETQSVDSFG